MVQSFSSLVWHFYMKLFFSADFCKVLFLLLFAVALKADRPRFSKLIWSRCRLHVARNFKGTADNLNLPALNQPKNYYLSFFFNFKKFQNFYKNFLLFWIKPGIKFIFKPRFFFIWIFTYCKLYWGLKRKELSRKIHWLGLRQILKLF